MIQCFGALLWWWLVEVDNLQGQPSLQAISNDDKQPTNDDKPSNNGSNISIMADCLTQTKRHIINYSIHVCGGRRGVFNGNMISSFK